MNTEDVKSFKQMLEELRQIYQEYKTELATLRKKKEEIISDILKTIDDKKSQKIVNALAVEEKK